ncbi:hypothetical protein RJ640_008025 [Escallonia rubra]|uniref:Association with the SNF1 complex (ASC) domain-containing protein n=1 Tax=Escallonia rubra TaxID=112253 RepID=A0AA88QLD1_9ASTE|nr:hypothetical protein RJ640_008025 [Escallonia rubra]
MLHEYVPEDVKSISGFEPPQSPDSIFNNLHPGAEDYAKEPPLVPPHLQMTLLNVPASHMEIPPPSSRPQHVVLQVDTKGELYHGSPNGINVFPCLQQRLNTLPLLKLVKK